MKGKSKRIFSGATAIVTALAILMSGALAWYAGTTAINAFRGTRAEDPPTNPMANLHDDFDDPSAGGKIDKKVYVENTGDTDVYVRVMLTETLKIGDGTPVTTVHMPKGDDVAGCDDLHGDFDWTMGNTDKDAQRYASIKGGTTWDTLSDNEKAALVADGLGSATITGDVKVDLTSKTKDKTTSTTDVITMAAYSAKSDTQKRAYIGWVYDVDGYAYWSQPLAKDTATGLLLSAVTVPEEGTMDYEYDIQVDMEFVDITDIGAWLEVGSDGKRIITVNSDNQMTSSSNDEGAIIKEGPKGGGTETTIEASEAAKKLLEDIVAIDGGFSFEKDEIILNIGDEITAPVAKDNEGNEVTIESWENEDDTIATVDPDTGDVVANEVGETVVTGNIDDESADYKIIVTDKLQVGEEDSENDGKVSVKVDETKTIPTITNAKGETVAPSTLTWTGLNEAVATFDKATGEVTGVTVGTTTMVGTDGKGNKATVAITVTAKDKEERDFSFGIENLILNIGEEANAPVATIVGGTATVPIASWANEKENVAEVNQTTGYVVAKAVGTTTVTGTDADDNSADYNIEVIDELLVGEPTDENDPDYDELGLYGGKVTVEVDQTALIPTIRNTKGEVIAPSTLTWTGINESIATFNSGNRRVTGISIGETTMVGTDGKGNKATVLIKVVGEPVERVLRVINAPTQINVGYPLNPPTIVDQDNKLATIVKWESDAPSFLQVNQITGALTGVDARAETVKITATDDEGVTVSFNVKVIKELQLPIGASRDIEVKKDDSVVVVLLMEAQGKTLTVDELDWVMANTTIATFDAGASRITGKTVGVTTLTGTDDFGNTITFNIEVLPKDALTLTPINPPTNMNQGDEVITPPRIEDEKGNRVTIEEWESGDTSILTVDPDTGKITAKGPGTTTVKGIDEDGNEVTFPITVTDILTATPANVEVKKGGEANIPAIKDVNGKTVDPKEDIETWVSSDPTKATIDPETGKINGLQVGTTTLTGTDEHGNKVVINVTVLAKDPVTLTPVDPPTNMNKGDEEEGVKATGPDGEDVPIVEWESSNPDVVYVDPETGDLVAKQPGDAVITGTDEDGNTIEFPIHVTTILTADDMEVGAGFTKPLSTITGANGETVDYKDLTWTNSDATKATLNEETGVVSGIVAGATTLTGVDEHGNKVEIEVTITGLTADEKLRDALQEDAKTIGYNAIKGIAGGESNLVGDDEVNILPYYDRPFINGKQQPNSSGIIGDISQNYGRIAHSKMLNTASEYVGEVSFRLATPADSDVPNAQATRVLDVDEDGKIVVWYLPTAQEVIENNYFDFRPLATCIAVYDNPETGEHAEMPVHLRIQYHGIFTVGLNDF